MPETAGQTALFARRMADRIPGQNRICRDDIQIIRLNALWNSMYLPEGPTLVAG